MVKGGNRLDDIKNSGIGKNLSRFDRKLTYGSKYGSIGKDGSKQIDFNKYDLSGILNTEYYKKLPDASKKEKAIWEYIQENPEVRQSYNYNGVRWKTIGVITVLSVLSIIMSILVADIYNNSSKKITEDETAQGAYKYVISSITAVLTVVVTLLIAAMATKYKLIMFMILFGIFGIATSAIGIYWIEHDPDMSKTYSKDKWNFLIAAIVIWIMVILAALVSMAI